MNNIYPGIGGIATTMNPQYTAHEVCRQLKMSKSKMILTQQSSLHVVQEAIGQLGGGISPQHFIGLGGGGSTHLKAVIPYNDLVKVYHLRFVNL